ncbi:hypothetical protein WJX73_009763 [Symbiochloris irregularis]|uniref:Regulator of MON1-CCZ1 complex N-terminal domain-containing protein n=1 Tax=Symbiochloris irregularis TaxID=706552 RepID=A0AAW1P1M9_9CHLO
MSPAKRSVHRSPTPEPEEEEAFLARDLTLQEQIKLKLLKTGTLERCKKLLRERLEECGWCEEVKHNCKEVLREKQDATVADLVKAARPPGQQRSTHVQLQASGVVIDDSSAAALHVDEAAGLVLAVRGQEIVCYSLAHPDQAPQATQMGEGPQPSAVTASLDGATLAVQRSPAQVQLLQRTGRPRMCIQSAQSRAPLLGCFWTLSADGDFVMVTRAGWEMYRWDQARQSLRLSAQNGHPVFWWRYSHAARLLLLGTGDIGLWLQAYQFREDGGTVKLPPFQIGAVTPGGTPTPPAASRLDPSALWVVVLYGRIYCAYLDRRLRRLHLHRFYMDAVVPQQVYTMPGSSMALSVVDNLLIAHHCQTGVSLIIDVRAASSPLAPPLALHLPPQSTASIQQCASWKFHLPNLVLSPRSGEVWRCGVNVRGIAISMGADRKGSVGFLMRRAPSAHPSIDIPALVIDILKAALVERLALDVLAAVLDELHESPGVGSPKSSQHVTLSAEAVVEGVWNWLHTEEALDAPTLQATLAVYAASLAAHGLAIPASLHALALDIALQQGHQQQAAAALASHPAAASPALVQHLCSPAAAGLNLSAALSCRLHCRAGDYSGACASLLASGKVVQAARLAQRHGLTETAIDDIVSAAAESGDVHAVLSILQQGHSAGQTGRYVRAVAEAASSVEEQLPHSWRQQLAQLQALPVSTVS